MGGGMTLLPFLVLLLGCCGYALLRGGAPERIAAGLQLGAFAIDDAVHRFVDGLGYASLAVGSTVVDVALLVALTLLAWRSTRFWPVWIAGWQAAAIVAHMAKLVDPAMLPAGYAIQAQIWAYPMLIATAAGAWRHRRRLSAGDPDPAWKPMPA